MDPPQLFFIPLTKDTPSYFGNFLASHLIKAKLETFQPPVSIGSSHYEYNGLTKRPRLHSPRA